MEIHVENYIFKLNIINSQLLVVYGSKPSQIITYGEIATDIFISDSIFQGSNIHNIICVSGGVPGYKVSTV